MAKTSKWSVLVALVGVALQIFITITAFSRLEGAFQVVVVSLLGWIYLTVVDFGRNFDEYRAAITTWLHRELTAIKLLVGGQKDQGAEEEVKEIVEQRQKYGWVGIIWKLGHAAIFFIILWKFLKVVFLS